MGGMMFAMGVGFSAPYISCTRHWLPCYDEPDDKADSATLRFYTDTSGIRHGSLAEVDREVSGQVVGTRLIDDEMVGRVARCVRGAERNAMRRNLV